MATYQRPPWKPRSTARPYIAYSNGTDLQKTSPDRDCDANVPSDTALSHLFSAIISICCRVFPWNGTRMPRFVFFHSHGIIFYPGRFFINHLKLNLFLDIECYISLKSLSARSLHLWKLVIHFYSSFHPPKCPVCCQARAACNQREA